MIVEVFVSVIVDTSETSLPAGETAVPLGAGAVSVTVTVWFSAAELGYTVAVCVRVTTLVIETVEVVVASHDSAASYWGKASRLTIDPRAVTRVARDTKAATANFMIAVGDGVYEGLGRTVC